MSTNKLIEKIISKSSYDLEKMLTQSNQYRPEVIEAIKKELKERAKDGRLEKEKAEKEGFKELKGEGKYKEFLASVDTKYSFSSNPKAELSFMPDVRKDYIKTLIIKVFEDLEYDVLYYDEGQVEAKRRDEDFKNWTNKITVIINSNSELSVKSISLGNYTMNKRIDSKIVQLFKHVFEKLSANYSDEELGELKDNIERKENWDDYSIPKELTPPKNLKEPNLPIFVTVSLISSLFLGVLFGLITQQFYILILMDSLIGFALGYLLFQGVKMSNYTEHPRVLIISLVTPLVIILISQLTQYVYITESNGLVGLSFIEFMSERIKLGFRIADLNIGSWGYILVFILQYIFIGFTMMNRFMNNLLYFQAKRVPTDVLDFVYYHVIKGKTEREVRKELSKMNWKNYQDQQYVIEDFSAIEELKQIDREE
jgi:F0F1-type ATP synthase assembly protein I